MRTARSIALSVTFPALLLSAGPADAGVYTYRTIVLSGDAAPGTIGGSFTAFGPPTLNASGQVAFRATTSSVLASSGMWMTLPGGQIQLMAGTGYPYLNAPPDVRFGTFHLSGQPPLINDNGNAGFAAPLSGLGNGEKSGVFRRLNGFTEKVAIPGDPAPGAPAGVHFDSISTVPGFNQGDLMAFSTSFSGPGVTPANADGVYMHWFGGLQLLKRSGWSAPGIPGGTFGSTLSSRIQIANNGRTGFGMLIHQGADARPSTWSGWPAALTMHVIQGEISPIGHPFGSPGGLDTISLTQNGMSFNMEVNDGFAWQTGLWYHNGNAMETIAFRTGPGPLGTYAGLALNSLMSASNGTTSFIGRFEAPETANTALMRWTPGTSPASAHVVVREGDPVYGWGGLQYDDLLSVPRPILDDHGRSSIIANVRGPGVNPSNDQGMWVREAHGGWHLVLRRGQSMTLSDGIARQVVSFSVYAGLGMYSGFRPAITNDGDIAMHVTFADQTQAIIIAERPRCLADLNNDGTVNLSDLLMLLASWGTCI